MILFRGLLAILFAIILIYTLIVVSNDGIDLLTVFFGDIAKMGWAGQFNVDFGSYLTLSALWLAWRHDFSIKGLCFAVLGFFGGALFLTVYLFFTSLSARGDMKVLLLGARRAAA